MDLFSRTGTDVALVILDLIMPGMSGIETFRRLKEIDPRVKVLFASGYSLPKDAERLSREDHNGFIQKPYRIQDLSLKVREILDA
jgi:CheY-like chemotaxis protein